MIKKWLWFSLLIFQVIFYMVNKKQKWFIINNKCFNFSWPPQTIEFNNLTKWNKRINYLKNKRIIWKTWTKNRKKSTITIKKIIKRNKRNVGLIEKKSGFPASIYWYDDFSGEWLIGLCSLKIRKI